MEPIYLGLVLLSLGSKVDEVITGMTANHTICEE